MSKVIAVHRQEPNWPEDRPRHRLEIGGVVYWVETDGRTPPDVGEVRRIVGLDPTPQEPQAPVADPLAALAEMQRRLAQMETFKDLLVKEAATKLKGG